MEEIDDRLSGDRTNIFDRGQIFFGHVFEGFEILESLGEGLRKLLPYFFDAKTKEKSFKGTSFANLNGINEGVD